MKILTIETHTERTFHILSSQQHNRFNDSFVIQLNESHCVAIPHSYTSWEIGEFGFTYQATNLPHKLHTYTLYLRLRLIGSRKQIFRIIISDLPER